MPPKTNFDFDWPELHLCSTNDATCVVSAASTGDWEYINGDDCAAATRTNICWTPEIGLGEVWPNTAPATRTNIPYWTLEEIDLGGTWPKTQDSTNPYTLNSIPFKYKLRHR